MEKKKLKEEKKRIYQWLAEESFFKDIDRVAALHGFTPGHTNRGAFLRSILDPIIEKALKKELENPQIMDKLTFLAQVKEWDQIIGNSKTRIENTKIVCLLAQYGRSNLEMISQLIWGFSDEKTKRKVQNRILRLSELGWLQIGEKGRGVWEINPEKKEEVCAFIKTLEVENPSENLPPPLNPS